MVVLILGYALCVSPLMGMHVIAGPEPGRTPVQRISKNCITYIIRYEIKYFRKPYLNFYAGFTILKHVSTKQQYIFEKGITDFSTNEN